MKDQRWNTLTKATSNTLTCTWTRASLKRMNQLAKNLPAFCMVKLLLLLSHNSRLDGFRRDSLKEVHTYSTHKVRYKWPEVCGCIFEPRKYWYLSAKSYHTHRIKWRQQRHHLLFHYIFYRCWDVSIYIYILCTLFALRLYLVSHLIVI